MQCRPFFDEDRNRTEFRKKIARKYKGAVSQAYSCSPNTVVTQEPFLPPWQNRYCTDPGVHQKRLANTMRAFSVM